MSELRQCRADVEGQDQSWTKFRNSRTRGPNSISSCTCGLEQRDSGVDTFGLISTARTKQGVNEPNKATHATTHNNGSVSLFDLLCQATCSTYAESKLKIVLKCTNSTKATNS